MNYKSIKISLAVLFVIFFQFSANAQLADEIPLTADNQLLGLGTQYILKSEYSTRRPSYHYFITHWI